MARILVFNAGSSSLKFSLYEVGKQLAVLYEGALTGLGSGALGHTAQLCVHNIKTGTHETHDLGAGIDSEAGVGAVMDVVETLCAGAKLLGVGHRIVHGGARYDSPVLIDEAVCAYLETLVALAPLHQPPALKVIAAVAKLHSDLPQITCFDTAFHHGQTELVTRFALPRALFDQGIRRYGFHGISYSFIARRLGVLPQAQRERVIAMHLGSGCSVCAMCDGKSVASSMGFTALDGVMMARRPGSLDPGVVLHLQEALGMSPHDITHMLYYDSGLYGVSGESDDMRVLLASKREEAAQAIAMFCDSVARMVASLAVSLGGVDSLIFTAGIGEHASPIRAQICERLAFLGVEVDRAKNEAALVPPFQRITSDDSKISAYVIPTDEDGEIARAVMAVVGAAA